MARAGFTAITSGTIRFGKDGRWYCDDEPIPNRAICQLYSRTLRILPDGRARLELGEDKADVVIEDTPWVVTGIDRGPSGDFTVTLSDGTREPLDPASLRTSGEHVLYCRVKGGAHEARFLRPAYYELMRHTEAGPAGECVLTVGNRRVVLSHCAA
jgi:hypothetical protein